LFTNRIIFFDEMEKRGRENENVEENERVKEKG
jgi:hypothetical protein